MSDRLQGIRLKSALDGKPTDCRSAIFAAQKMAFALTVRGEATLEQPQLGRASGVLTALFASGHLVGFGSPLADVAARRKSRQFERLAARCRHLRHFFCGKEGRPQDQPG